MLNLRDSPTNWPMKLNHLTFMIKKLCVFFVVDVDTKDPKSYFDIHGSDLVSYIIFILILICILYCNISCIMTLLDKHRSFKTDYIP